MDIGYVLIMIIIWSMILLFGSILGVVVGAVMESIFGFKLMYYIGFVFGVIAFILYIGQFLFGDGRDFKHQSKPRSPFTAMRRARMAKRIIK